ncbi:pentatricopeptide repeat-containing protein At5g50990 [Daucus carota subsp. sativus]|uniref:pentatricopeptide repeat-containing protein At5g50990 n=1 Tax=Daucus carota subsp. sativus TaxID=79200 RepID=UPI0007EF3AC1|nr:PREDICTED: pentatricopeptide repeat-containing protein At5g50990-like [Daucus carota subsp. sativus]
MVTHTLTRRLNQTAQMINSCTDYGTLFSVLQECRLSPNSINTNRTHSSIIKLGYGNYPSLVSLLVSAYISCDEPILAKRLFSEVHCLDFGLVDSNLMIARFMKMGEADVAKKVFEKMHTRDLVSWNSIIGGCVKNARYEEGFSYFRKMLRSEYEPDGFTFASIITGCARTGALGHAKWIHSLMIERKIELNYILSSALIDMYSKCGRIEEAKAIFDSVQKEDVSVWNSMINGFAVHGLASDAIAIFTMMEEKNIPPDAITFIGILTACSHSGLVEQGRKFFDLMETHYLVHPQIEHYGAMVDLLGRAGLLEEAFDLIKRMLVEPDVVIWRAFLSACRTYRNSDMAEVAVEKISRLESGDYVLLSNTYSSLRQWDSAARVRDGMKQKGVHKGSGKSWVETGGLIHHFKSGDHSHPETVEIYKVLEKLISRTRMEGFMSSTELVLMDISEEEKEQNLNYHSEKLAVAYAILKSSPRTEIQVSKNLRTCIDCHYWMKIVSRILNRVIIVRDRIRFHRFEGGLCTCGDFW